MRYLFNALRENLSGMEDKNCKQKIKELRQESKNLMTHLGNNFAKFLGQHHEIIISGTCFLGSSKGSHYNRIPKRVESKRRSLYSKLTVSMPKR